MIFFLNRAEPIRLTQSLRERGRSALLALQKRFKSPYGGALSVQHNLKLELRRQKDFFWAAADGSYPDKSVDVAWAINSVHDLAYAYTLKEKGLVKKVWGGPNLVVVPQEAGTVLQSDLLDAYIVPCHWVADFYAQQEPQLTKKLSIWPVGIDTDYWQDTFNLAKNTLLIYNKNQSELTQTIEEQARRLNLQTRVIHYGSYTPEDYRNALAVAWGMVWLSGSETQGLACLEALSVNVPVLAWDPGRWDYESIKMRKHFSCAASSVPYFDATCGEVFTMAGEFLPALERFRAHLQMYQPRACILRQNLDVVTNLRLLTPLHAV